MTDITMHLWFGIILVFIVLFFLFFQQLSQNHTLKSELRKKEELSTGSHLELRKIMETTYNSIVIIQKNGTIRYVNTATEAVLGSTKTVGLNIFHFDTVKGTPLELAFLETLKGEVRELFGYHHISVSTRENKYLNISMVPFNLDENGEVSEVLMVSSDVTKEKELSSKLEENFLATFKSFASIVDSHDVFMGAHSANVNRYTARFLEEFQFTPEEKRDILVAATLHDIGKVGISDFILNKQESLTEAEYEIMKTHTMIGAELLQYLDQFYNCAKIIRDHHERWDGFGYPMGLKGNEITLGAQIISIADAYDTIVSKRSYKEACTMEEGIAELRANKWTQFNGDYVELFIQSLEIKTNREEDF